MIIAIICPIRFKKEMMDKYVDLSMQGHIVLLPVDLEDSNQVLARDINEESLMQLHKDKIDLSDKVHVVNVGGYMGRGTYEEIGYATVKNKPIEYLEPINKEDN